MRDPKPGESGLPGSRAAANHRQSGYRHPAPANANTKIDLDTMKHLKSFTLLLLTGLAAACKPDKAEIAVAPEGRLVRQITQYVPGDSGLLAFEHAFSYDARGEVSEVETRMLLQNEVQAKDRYEYLRENDHLAVTHYPGSSGTAEFVFQFELGESGHLLSDRNKAGIYPAYGLPPEYAYTYSDGYVLSVSADKKALYSCQWENGNLTGETLHDASGPSSKKTFLYAPEENKTNIDILALTGASESRPGRQGSEITAAYLFYFGGKKSRNLPSSCQGDDGTTRLRYAYEYDAQGCPVRIETLGSDSTVLHVWEIAY